MKRPSEKFSDGLPRSNRYQADIQSIEAFALFTGGDIDVFHLRVSGEHHFVGFAADTRSFVAAKRRAGRQAVVAVYPNATSFQCVGNTQAAVDVGTPHCAAPSRIRCRWPF